MGKWSDYQLENSTPFTQLFKIHLNFEAEIGRFLLLKQDHVKDRTISREKSRGQRI